jgi:hypothetical protein
MTPERGMRIKQLIPITGWWRATGYYLAAPDANGRRFHTNPDDPNGTFELSDDCFAPIIAWAVVKGERPDDEICAVTYNWGEEPEVHLSKFAHSFSSSSIDITDDEKRDPEKLAAIAERMKEMIACEWALAKRQRAQKP